MWFGSRSTKGAAVDSTAVDDAVSMMSLLQQRETNRGGGAHRLKESHDIESPPAQLSTKSASSSSSSRSDRKSRSSSSRHNHHSSNSSRYKDHAPPTSPPSTAESLLLSSGSSLPLSTTSSIVPLDDLDLSNPKSNCLRAVSFVGLSLLMSVFFVIASVRMGLLHLHPHSTSSPSDTPSAVESLPLPAVSIKSAAFIPPLELDANPQSTQNLATIATMEHELTALRQEVFSLRNAATVASAAVATASPAIAEASADGDTAEPPTVTVPAPTPALAPAANIAAGPKSLKLQMRHQLNVHMLSRLFDKLLLGWPVVIGVLGGSISGVPSHFLPHGSSYNYAALFVTWLNEQFPVEKDSAKREALGIPHENRHGEHLLLNRAVGGTSSASSSFCWQELFDLNDVHKIPDLILIDYTVNDAFTLAGNVYYEQGVPLNSADNMERLTRSILREIETRRAKKLRENAQQVQQSLLKESSSATPVDLHALEDEAKKQAIFQQAFHAQLQTSALFFVLFVAQRREGDYLSREYSHKLIARKYSIPYASQKDFLRSPLEDPDLFGYNTTILNMEEERSFKNRKMYASPMSSMRFLFNFEQGTSDGIHANEAGHRLMFHLIQQRFDNLLQNYMQSNRTSLDISGEVATLHKFLRGEFALNIEDEDPMPILHSTTQNPLAFPPAMNQLGSLQLSPQFAEELSRQLTAEEAEEDVEGDLTNNLDVAPKAGDSKKKIAGGDLLINRRKFAQMLQHKHSEKLQAMRQLILQDLKEEYAKKVRSLPIPTSKAAHHTAGNAARGGILPLPESSKALTEKRNEIYSIISAPPLPLGKAHHPFNTIATSFTCRKLYYPYAPMDIDKQPIQVVNKWMGLIENQGWAWYTHPQHHLKKGLAPAEGWIQAEQARLAQTTAASDGRITSGESEGADTAVVPTPAPASGSEIELKNGLRFPAVVFQSYPKLTFKLTAPVKHMALMFYLRSWKDMGSVVAWLSCVDEKGHEVGRSNEQHLQASWSVQSTQAAAAVLWPSKEVFEAAEKAQRNGQEWIPPQPPCAFNRLNIYLTEPASFVFIGHAES